MAPSAIPSGLQAHSVSLAYPLSVQGKETPDGTRYGLFNATRGAFLPLAFHATAADADNALDYLLANPVLARKLIEVGL